MESKSITFELSSKLNSKHTFEEKLPSFAHITKLIHEENAKASLLSGPYLKKYEENRKEYDFQGQSISQIHLITAFCQKLEANFPILKGIQVQKTISLFSTFLMMREFEIIIWFIFCQEETIKSIFNLAGNQEQIKKEILNHLINTAYFTKQQVSKDEEFKQFQYFFDQNFQIFQGKHTDWLLLSEPDTSQLTPVAINKLYKNLLDYYQQFCLPKCVIGQVAVDLNLLAKKICLDGNVSQSTQMLRRVENEKIQVETKKREQKAMFKISKVKLADDNLSKQVSNLILNQLQTPKMQKQPFISDTPLVNQNDYCIDMQSRIYHMNSIMKSLLDENQILNLRDSNYAPNLGIPFNNNSLIGIQFQQNQMGNSFYQHFYQKNQTQLFDNQMNLSNGLTLHQESRVLLNPQQFFAQKNIMGQQSPNLDQLNQNFRSFLRSYSNTPNLQMFREQQFK